VDSSPDVIELLHDLADYFLVVGYDTGLEVSSVLALGAHAGACEIGAAGIGEAAVDYHGFEMDSGAQDSLHAAYQIRVLVEISSKGRARFSGVQQPYLHMFVDKIGQDLEKRDHSAAFVHVKIFQVRGGDPNKSASACNSTLNHLFVYISVRNVIEHAKRNRHRSERFNSNDKRLVMQYERLRSGFRESGSGGMSEDKDCENVGDQGYFGLF
jgi:hypothetical protein